MEMRANSIINSRVDMESVQQQQFCLKWNSFGSNLATSLSSLFKCETLADVTLFCDGVTFKAHKLILAACSKHLADLFETAPLHQNLLIILDGTSASNMAALLEFMYKGEVHVSQDALSSFLKAAECLQVKGLSIEHDKLAVAHHMEKQSPKHEDERPTPSPYSPMSPYSMHPPHYRPYDQRMTPVDRRSLRSPNDMHPESIRPSVLRDCSKVGRPPSPGPMSLAYRPSSSSSCSLPTQQEADAPPEHRFDQEPAATALICPEPSTNQQCVDPGCPEDLRIKMEPMAQDEQPTPSSTAPGSSTNGSPQNGPLGKLTGYENDKNDMVTHTIWNSVTNKLSHKSSSVSTPDGKKLKCPFCERLYGYETNLRAHIRQRHQGIRVPCPFCTRTFTRNNTVRRHIAREHKTELSLKAFQTQQVHNHNP
nr:zinc finger protein chinmo isoform X1 [Onthophagus taurus]